MAVCDALHATNGFPRKVDTHCGTLWTQAGRRHTLHHPHLRPPSSLPHPSVVDGEACPRFCRFPRRRRGSQAVISASEHVSPCFASPAHPLTVPHLTLSRGSVYSSSLLRVEFCTRPSLGYVHPLRLFQAYSAAFFPLLPSLPPPASPYTAHYFTPSLPVL